MQSKARALRQFYCAGRFRSLKPCLTYRLLHSTPFWRTDGVYAELTAMRVRIPWIQALQQQKAEQLNNQNNAESSDTLKERDLTPKKMSDSYHRVVRHPGRRLLWSYTRLTSIPSSDPSSLAKSMAIGQLS